MVVRFGTVALAVCWAGCSPLLDADFGSFSEGALVNGTTNLPGAPGGDQMVVAGEGGNLNLTIESGLFQGRHLRIPAGAAGGDRPSVTFRPVDPSVDSQIYVSFRARLSGGSTVGRLILHDLDYDPDSDLTLDLDPEPAQVGDTPVTPTGWKMAGTAGSLRVFLAINPSGNRLSVVVDRDGSSGADVAQFSAGGWRSDPPNFEITMTTTDGNGSFEVDEVLISESGPNADGREVAPGRDLEIERLLRELLRTERVGGPFTQRVDDLSGFEFTTNPVTSSRASRGR